MSTTISQAPDATSTSSAVSSNNGQNLSSNQNESKMVSKFLNYSLIGKPVVVKLNSGVEYRGILAKLDGAMNIAMEQTEEYFNGQLKNKYGDAFLRGNNVLYIAEDSKRWNLFVWFVQGKHGCLLTSSTKKKYLLGEYEVNVFFKVVACIVHKKSKSKRERKKMRSTLSLNFFTDWRYWTGPPVLIE